LWPHLHSDVGAVAREHVNVAANVKHMDVSIVRSRIGYTARLLRCGGKHFGFRRGFACRSVLYGSKKLAIQGFAAAERSYELNFVFVGVLADISILGVRMA